MRIAIGILLTFLIAAVAVPLQATAKPHIKTKYTYYTISGKSARSLYQQMIRRGPHIGRERAFATASMSLDPSFKLSGKKSCHFSRFRMNMEFEIRLPKVRNEKALPKSTRRHWRAFSKFVRRHEMRHRAIWISCIKKLERRVRKLRPRNCNSLESQFTRELNKAAKTCNRRQEAFDRAEQKRLARHPLIIAAERVPRKKRSAKRRKNSFSNTSALSGNRGTDTR